jgi:NADPH:quinone reductase-like Zn-dependent oxidoreductase
MRYLAWFTEVGLRRLLLGVFALITLAIGAYAEYVRVSRHMLIKKPANWSWEHAAAIPEVCVHRYPLPGTSQAWGLSTCRCPC